MNLWDAGITGFFTVLFGGLGYDVWYGFWEVVRYLMNMINLAVGIFFLGVFVYFTFYKKMYKDIAEGNEVSFNQKDLLYSFGSFFLFLIFVHSFFFSWIAEKIVKIGG